MPKSISFPDLQDLLQKAQQERDSSRWDGAISLFAQAEGLMPGNGAIIHNLAMAYFGKGDAVLARTYAKRAIKAQPLMWQSQALLAKIERAAGNAGGAEVAWRSVLKEYPGNAIALLGLADLEMNEFGDAQSAVDLVSPLVDDPEYASDAQLTALMCSLYTGTAEDYFLSSQLKQFSEAHLRLPLSPPKMLREGRRRIGLISPFFSLSPTYHLAISTLRILADHHDLICFSRGIKSDAGTDALRKISHEWLECAAIEPEALADELATFDLDILIDLGGWSDPAALKALSTKPAGRMYKWVGGQSATTGLSSFDGWIGDKWHEPADVTAQYSEPFLAMSGGYVDYTPPEGLLKHRERKKAGLGLVGNPVKVVEATFRSWPKNVRSVRLIDRRYHHARTKERVISLLERNGVAVEAVFAPESNAQYLEALSECEAIINTQPYSAGLTAVEAYWMDVKVIEASKQGQLFCARHNLSHSKTHGRNPKLPYEMLKLVSQ